jgi:hypothetical protein
VDIPYNAIVGRNFLQRTRAKICYETGIVILYGEKYEMIGKAGQLGEKGTKAAQITLPPRSESIVRLPVAPGSPQVGITDKRKLQEGVILAATLTWWMVTH